MLPEVKIIKDQLVVAINLALASGIGLSPQLQDVLIKLKALVDRE